MPRSVKSILPLLLTVALCTPLWAGDAAPASGNTAAAGYDSLTSSTIKSEGDAALRSGLVGLLVSKGLITSSEANSLLSGPASEVTANLLKLLKDKGLITNADLAQVTKTAMPASPAVPISAIPASTPAAVSAVIETPQSAAAQSTANPAAAGPTVIPAVAPLRVLPIDVPKQSGMIPDIKLGSGANMKLYGFYKASAVSDTASSGGGTFGANDFPLPLLLADTGPTSDPQVHLKARSFRIGMQTEWVPKGSDFTITGRVEGDFEGDYTDVNNRNISSVRNGQFSLRLAWVRLDHKIGNLPWFAQFGQDWTIFGSSTLPSLFETTGLGIAMGSLYERAPQFRTGIQFPAGDIKIQPEFAIVMPIAATSTLTTDQRLRFGDRAGAESNQPGLQARVVFQFPLSHSWKGVAPAQLIFSGERARINEIIPHAAQTPTSFICAATPCTIPTPLTNLNAPNIGFTNTLTILGASNCPEATGTCTLEQIFPHGVQASNMQNGYTGEIQLPTPWVTLVAKFYRGEDLRFFFATQLNDVYSNLGALAALPEQSGVSFSGKAITFGCAGGASVVGALTPTFDCAGSPVLPAKLQPVAGTGGFAELSFPLSRIFHANPEGHNSGWVLHVQYGTDRANYRDSQHTAGHLGRTDLDTVSLTYRLNKWVTFVHEASYIVTFTANDHEASGAILPHKLLFAGVDTRQAHNWRNEFGPIFTF